MQFDVFPVVEAGAFEMLIVDLKSERLDEVERCERGGAQARNTPRIRRYFRLKKNDVHQFSNKIVTGPSLTRATFICAWNWPVATLKPAPRSRSVKIL